MKKLKINNLVSQKIEKKDMKCLIGGGCICGCNGPSSNQDNGCANEAGDLYSPGGGTYYENCEPTIPGGLEP